MKLELAYSVKNLGNRSEADRGGPLSITVYLQHGRRMEPLHFSAA